MENELVSNAFTYDDRYRALLLAFGIIIMVFVMFLIAPTIVLLKQEEGDLYLFLFGMTNRKIGRLLFMETMIVGLTALALGIGIGIFFKAHCDDFTGYFPGILYRRYRIQYSV